MFILPNCGGVWGEVRFLPRISTELGTDFHNIVLIGVYFVLICGYFAELQRRAVWFLPRISTESGTDFHNIVVICALFCVNLCIF